MSYFYNASTLFFKISFISYSIVHDTVCEICYCDRNGGYGLTVWLTNHTKLYSIQY